MMQEELSSYLSSEGQESAQKVDWYTLFKVSRNWQNGNFSSRQLQILQEQNGMMLEDVLASSSTLPDTEKSETKHVHPGTLIDSTQSHIFATFRTSDQIETCPSVLVFPSGCREDFSKETSQGSLARYQSSVMASKKYPNLFISSLVVDRGEKRGSNVRLFVGYSSGDSSILHFDCATNHFHDEILLDDKSSECIVAAALYCDMLVTCTSDFRLRIFNMVKDKFTLIEERRTYSCHWPASFRLEPVESKNDDGLQFRLSIAYSSPVYPMGWTVGLQELVIGTSSTLSSRSASARRAHVITCIDSPTKQEKKRNHRVEVQRNKEQIRNQVGRLTSLSYENPFIVVGTKDNDVICYRVAVVGSTDEICTSTGSVLPALELSHVCTFQGHTGTVHSVSLSEGRCVTGGSDGSVRIWRLGDEESAVAKAAGLLTTIDASLRRGLGKVVTIGASSSSSAKRKGDEVEAVHSSAPLSLADILGQIQSTNGSANKSYSSSVVRLVSSAFDRIISVSAFKTSSTPIPTSTNSFNCRAEANLEREEEQVQIWNFS